MKSDNIINLSKSKIDFEEHKLSLLEREKAVLVGNPNVGKSLIFNHLSGMYVDVSNFPGTTVAVSKCNYKNIEVIDTPGIYGVSSFNDEEKVARDVIIESDVVVNVVNALNLDRDLFLTLQLIDMGKKVSVILNFADEIQKRKIKIDVKKLSEILGVEVIETSAVKKSGFDKLDYAMENARVGNQQFDIHFMLQQYLSKVKSQSEALLILEGDEFIAERYSLPMGSGDDREKIYIGKRNRISEIVDEIEYEDSKKGYFLNTLGRLALKPSTGLPMLAAVLVLVYLFIGDFVSQKVVDFTENTIGVELFENNVKSFVANYTGTTIDVEILNAAEEVVTTESFYFPDGINADPQLETAYNNLSENPNSALGFHFENPFVKILFGEFGVFTMTITYLIFLLLPLVIAFYFVMALLEDSGYLPRLATMLDRAFNKLGLNGRAVIPIMLGFGCITMANVTTRILGTNREKSIVTAILQFVIPCSAQLAVIAVLLAGAGAVPFMIYGAVILTVLVTLSTILNKMIPGESSPLLIDLPTMGIPKLNNVFKKTVDMIPKGHNAGDFGNQLISGHQ